MTTSPVTDANEAAREALFARLVAGDFARLDDPETPPWFEPGITAEVHPQFFCWAIRTYSTKAISLRGSRDCFHLCEDETFPPRLYWERDGLNLARELTPDEFSLLSLC